jgi:hypothetical protein
LTEGLFKFKPSINVTQQSDEDPHEDGTKNNHEKRKRSFGNLKPVIILNGDE